MSIAVSDVLLRVGDHVGNYSTGQADVAQKIRAVDSAVNYLKRKIGFPGDERKYSLLFGSDVMYYDLPVDFQESITLNYQNSSYNVPANYWDYRPYQEILARTGMFGHNTWGHITAHAGRHQLLLSGQNINQGTTIETFDMNVWTPSGDASAATLDTVVKVQGSASQRFTITHATGTATLTSPTLALDLRDFVEQRGAFRCYFFLPTVTDLTNLKIRYQSSTGNYYEATATNQADGTNFEANEFNLVSFSTVGAVATGTPDLSSINEIQLIWTTGAGFGTQASCRVDWLYTIIPDELDLIYYSKYKGTDASGATQKVTLTSESDIITLDEDFIEPISLKAALYLAPQLLRDATFQQLYQAEFTDVIRTWARSWPRKRIENNYLRTVLRR